MPHVLIVDDDPQTLSSLKVLVAEEMLSVAVASSLREARVQMARHVPDLILTDLRLPDGSGLALLEEQEEAGRAIDCVMMTGYASVETAIDALRLGAVDYLPKPVNFNRLKAILQRIPRTDDLKAEIGSLRGQLRSIGRFGHLLGQSPTMQVVYDQIEKVSQTGATVLLLGDSGTGKELAARTLHELSARRREMFLPVNCGAISSQLIESEVFGHEKGSFTGAERQHLGYFERANHGTLLLDEITEMPLALQVRLLRVLETGRFTRVGGQREIETDVRVVAATNRDPLQAVAEGRLREDLYHRLNVFPIRLPPLRERGDDILLIGQSMLDTLNAEYGTSKTFSPALREVLLAHDWPGNVRELRNTISRACILADDVLEPCHTSLAPRRLHSVTPPGTDNAVAARLATEIAVGMTLQEAERALILATLAHCRGVRKQTAEVLGISLKTLYNRLAEYADVPGMEGTG